MTSSRDGEPIRRGFQLLEHQADVGIRAVGATLAEAFEEAALGLIEILGVRPGGPTRRRIVRASGADAGAVLVEFLNELVLLHESEAVALADPRVTNLSDTELEASVDVAPLAAEPEGIVKAATYHRLSVREEDGSAAVVEVYLDV